MRLITKVYGNIDAVHAVLTMMQHMLSMYCFHSLGLSSIKELI